MATASSSDICSKSGVGRKEVLVLTDEAVNGGKNGRGRPPRPSTDESEETRNLYPVDAEVLVWFPKYQMSWPGYVEKVVVDMRIVKLYHFSKPARILLKNIYASSEDLSIAKKLPLEKVVVGWSTKGIRERQKYIDRIKELAFQEQEKDSQRRMHGESSMPTLPDVRLEPATLRGSGCLEVQNLLSCADEKSLFSESEDWEPEELNDGNENVDDESQRENATDKNEPTDVSIPGPSEISGSPVRSLEEMEAEFLKQKRNSTFAVNGIKNMLCNLVDRVAIDLRANRDTLKGVAENEENPVCGRVLLDAIIEKLLREKRRDKGAQMVDDAGWLSTFWATKELVEEANKDFGGLIGNDYSKKTNTPARPWSCGICIPTKKDKLVWNSRHSWSTHVKMHLLTCKEFVCPHPECEESWPEKCLLKSHIPIHGYTKDRAEEMVKSLLPRKIKAADVPVLSLAEAKLVQDSYEITQKQLRLEAKQRKLESEQNEKEEVSSSKKVSVAPGQKRRRNGHRMRVKDTKSSTSSCSGEHGEIQEVAQVAANSSRGAAKVPKPRRKQQIKRPPFCPPAESTKKPAPATASETDSSA